MATKCIRGTKCECWNERKSRCCASFNVYEECAQAEIERLKAIIENRACHEPYDPEATPDCCEWVIMETSEREKAEARVKELEGKITKEEAIARVNFTIKYSKKCSGLLREEMYGVACGQYRAYYSTGLFSRDEFLALGKRLSDLRKEWASEKGD